MPPTVIIGIFAPNRTTGRQTSPIFLRTYRDLRLWSMPMILRFARRRTSSACERVHEWRWVDELSTYCLDRGRVGRSVQRQCFLVRKQRQLRWLQFVRTELQQLL